MVVHEGILFDTPILIASILDASNQNCGPVISVSWTAVTGAVYQLERRINGGAWTAVDILTGLSFSETGSPGLYEYRVKVIKGSKSAYSNTDAVTVYAQNEQLSTYCVGYDLWETYRNGCNTANRLIQALSPSCGVIYGCMDNSAQNYNPNATHSNGTCTWAVTSCLDTAPPFWCDGPGAGLGVVSQYTVTDTITCPHSGSGVLTGVAIATTNNATTNTIVSATYSGNIATIVFTTNDKWHWVTISWTGVQQLSS